MPQDWNYGRPSGDASMSYKVKGFERYGLISATTVEDWFLWFFIMWFIRSCIFC